MKRKIIEKLNEWFTQNDRKPLVMRGARQVGKTWIVRYFADQLNLKLFELNFERDSSLKNLFKDNDPQKTILQLELYFNAIIDTKNALIFLDEIQTAPEILAKLRWFAEEKPEYAIIATGSLLDFALDDHNFSMPVGRIQYMYLEPMSFEEFLLASKQNKLHEFLLNYQLHDEINETIHKQLMRLINEYIFIGGMPAAIKCWLETKSLIKVNEIHQNILTTYRDDFTKYAKKISNERFDEIFRAIPKFIGAKFKYSAVNSDIRTESLKNALNLLCKARVCHKVLSCSANGIPLDAFIKENIFKVIFIDVGLVSSALRISFTQHSALDEFNLINKGGITEQLVGQLLRVIKPFYIDSKLYYWVSEKVSAESEIDYLIQQNMNIIPVEVKAGKTGTLRSLHNFMKQKHLKKAVRLNGAQPSVLDVKTKDSVGDLIEYKLISLPLYLTEQVERLVYVNV